MLYSILCMQLLIGSKHITTYFILAFNEFLSLYSIISSLRTREGGLLANAFASVSSRWNNAFISMYVFNYM